MLCTIAPRTVASLELRVFSVTARQCVKVLSDSSYSLRWKSAFASESSCSGAGRGHGERQPGDAEGPGGCEGECEAEGRRVGSQGAMAQDLPLEALQRLLVHVGADLRVVVGDAVEERGRDLPDALLALPLMGTHHPRVAHPESVVRGNRPGDVLGANADS